MPRNGRSTDLYSGPQPFFCHQGPASSEIIFPRTGGRWFQDDSVQFSSVAQSCPTLCNPMNRSTPGLPAHHQLPEFTQTFNLFLNEFDTLIFLLVIISLHFLFPESSLPVSRSLSLTGVHTASGTLGRLSLLPLNKLKVI